MKRILYIFALISVLACEKHEFGADTKTVYPYEPFQDIVIDVDVYPVGDIELFFEDMDLEVNADYFNRYGIGINLNLKERLEYPVVDGLPKVENGSLTVFIVPQKYIKFQATAAYTMIVRNSSRTQYYTKIVLGESFQTNRTLAHEIGHALGLGHIKEKNNVMKLGYQAHQYSIPNDFNEIQVDTMMTNLDWYNNPLSGKSIQGFEREETIIIID